jgi:mRNA interferase YafQ
MKSVVYSSQFKKDFKLIAKRPLDLAKLQTIIDLLREEQILPATYRPHPLKGNYKGYDECHIEPDWLLIYKITTDEIYLARTGTHSDLF